MHPPHAVPCRVPQPRQASGGAQVAAENKKRDATECGREKQNATWDGGGKKKTRSGRMGRGGDKTPPGNGSNGWVGTGRGATTMVKCVACTRRPQTQGQPCLHEEQSIPINMTIYSNNHCFLNADFLTIHMSLFLRGNVSCSKCMETMSPFSLSTYQSALA